MVISGRSKLSPVKLMSALLERIGRLDPKLMSSPASVLWGVASSRG
jgi:hypothetical protein